MLISIKKGQPKNPQEQGFVLGESYKLQYICNKDFKKVGKNKIAFLEKVKISKPCK